MCDTTYKGLPKTSEAAQRLRGTNPEAAPGGLRSVWAEKLRC